MLVLAVVLLGAGQSRTGPYLGQKPPGTTPEIFAPGIISTGLDEVLCAFMPHNDDMIFNVIYRKPHSPNVHSALVRSHIKNGTWTYPEVMTLSGDGYVYLYPFISYDGKELYFQSDMPTGRPELRDKYNIWRCQRNGGEWSAPEPLPPPVNGRGDVSGPSMSASGEFYFTLMSGRPDLDGIYRSQRRNGAFSEPERLPESVNVKQGSFDGVVSPDGGTYLVNVYRKEDSYGETDLYVSFRDEKGAWTPLRNLGPRINSKLNEGSARISADGWYIFFSAFSGNPGFYSQNPSYADILNNRLKPQAGNSDIYWVSAQVLEELRPGKSRKGKENGNEIVAGSAPTPGVIAAIQTFGDRISFPPHLHLLVTEGGVDRAGVFHKISRIDDSRLVLHSRPRPGHD